MVSHFCLGRDPFVSVADAGMLALLCWALIEHVVEPEDAAARVLYDVTTRYGQVDSAEDAFDTKVYG